MNDSEYLRGRCDQCGGDLEFPATAAGQSTACPLCGHNTSLNATTTLPETKVRPAKRSAARGVILAIAGAVAIALVGLKIIGSRTGPNEQPKTPPTVASNSAAENAMDRAAATPAAATNSMPAAPTKPRSLDDLKTGPVALEKAKNSSLVYAVGILRNESDHQRFGVTIEVELNDARGNAAGTAKDYRAVIEPRQEWRFRALVLNSKATEGKVARIREE